MTIGLEALDSQFDPWLDLIDPEGNVEVFDDDTGGKHNSLIRATSCCAPERTPSWHALTRIAAQAFTG